MFHVEHIKGETPKMFHVEQTKKHNPTNVPRGTLYFALFIIPNLVYVKYFITVRFWLTIPLRTDIILYVTYLVGGFERGKNYHFC